MNKILGIFIGAFCLFKEQLCMANEKFEILPDLPEVLMSSAVQASSVSTMEPTNALNTTTTAVVASQSVGNEPSLVSLIFSLGFVIVLIYVTGIIYAKLNKFGLRTLKRQMGDVNKTQVSVVSTTTLGGNKSLHVVELDGKRMLIGASTNSIHLIKDLGSISENIEDGEYSKIEIPNIRIPKIEIPKIEIPGINFSKLVTKTHKPLENFESDNISEKVEKKQNVENDFEISDIYEEENPDGIIDKLFQGTDDNVQEEQVENVHKVDPDEFALYKKYV